MELIRTAEVVGNVLRTAHNVGKFVVDHLTTGAWGVIATQYTDEMHTQSMEHLNNVARETE